MPAIAEAPTPACLAVNATLMEAVIKSTGNALTMCGLQADCVGAARVPHQESGIVTGMIGVHGAVSGFVTVNMSERFALQAVGGLMQEEFGPQLNSAVVDGSGELTNMVVGGIKSSLSTTEWAFSHITVPSVIVGKGYAIAYARGLEFLTTTFEYEDDDAVLLEDRLLHVSMSLLRR
ncbi:MAG: chemotaxis protein CheX [Planctomycetota bacterium]